MRTIICNEYDSCVNASITVLDDDFDVKDLSDEEVDSYLNEGKCHIDLCKVAEDLGGSKFILISYVDGTVDRIFRYGRSY